MAEDSSTRSRVAIVTGGGSGIGRAASLELARSSYAVVVADLNAASAHSVAAEIRAFGEVASGVGCDVSCEDQWGKVLDQAAELGVLETLVSNAAIYPRMAFVDTRLDDFDRVMAVYLRGAFLGVSRCLPIIRDGGGGSFVLLTSGSGQIAAVGNPMQRGFSLYGASKAALDRWALGIAPELAPLGVAVNLLCPGAVVLTEGVVRLQLGEEAPSETISAERMAGAIGYLAKSRPPAGTGGRYVATEFGRTWG